MNESALGSNVNQSPCSLYISRGTILFNMVALVWPPLASNLGHLVRRRTWASHLRFLPPHESSAFDMGEP
jgi:hypothetical protein